MEIRESQKFGIRAEITGFDFKALMERMRAHVKKSRDPMQRSLEEAEEFDYYPGEARFTGDHTLEVGGATLRGKTIFIAAGARPLIPQR